ncbi:mitochondrial splicing system protein [Mortierella antarctica]|nr:mitochondrial splicing system protein [Mortierella antarctica]
MDRPLYSTTALATSDFDSTPAVTNDFKPDDLDKQQYQPLAHPLQSESKNINALNRGDHTSTSIQASSVLECSAGDVAPTTMVPSSVLTGTVDPPSMASSAVALKPSTVVSDATVLQEGPAMVNVVSSAVSILSASGTLISNNKRRPSSTLPPPLSRATTAHTVAAALPPFDTNVFKSIMQELGTHIDYFEELSDQMLDAMTVYDVGRLGLSAMSSLSPLERPGSSGWEEKPKDLEEERRISAQTITDLISTAWPKLYQPCAAAAARAPSSPEAMQGGAQFHQTSKISRQQAKSATVLKTAIVTFWSAQNNFQERAQLVLDIYEDPTELESDDRIRGLRSRHLNNLLSSTLSPAEVAQLTSKFQEDQEKLTTVTEPLHAVWLGILILLEEYGKAAKNSAGEHAASNNAAHETLAQRLLRISRNKGQAFKRRPAELRYSDTHLDTIFALSTHPGKAGIAVIRVSGPRAKTVQGASRERTASSFIVMEAKPSWTVCYVASETLAHKYVWLNQENSQEAFENDKLDLTEVEGLADLLNAETEAQRRLALRQADLIQGMALIEALIDFGEDENIEDGVYDNVVAKVRTLHDEIQRHTNDDRCGEILRDGIHVTILGPPNAGKSSFLNFITKRQAAIVSPIPGTTRDVVEVSLDIGGYPILIGDTAGLRTSQDEIEMEGVKRAQDRIQLADINVAILPVTDFLKGSGATDNCEEGGGGVDAIVLDAIRHNPKTMVLINKMDLSGIDVDETLDKIRSFLWRGSSGQHPPSGDERSIDGERRLWAISCQTGEGIGPFLDDFTKILKERFETSLTSSTSITQYRHRKHLENCLQSLEAFLGKWRLFDLGVDDVVLGAEELRHAASDLGRITGRVDVEEVLDVVFREFCIGK